jgi:1-acyl-sn-glycerol-3-phosphate acyltransferase
MTIRSVLFFPIFLVLTLFFSLAAMLAALVDSSGDRAHQMGSIWGSCLLFFSGVRARITYLEPLTPGEAYVFAANHQSAYDILALLSKLGIQFRWLAKESLFKIPFMGWAMTRVGYIPINRSQPKSAYRSLLLAAKKVENGTSVLIFPEGTRQSPNQLGEFKKGGFILAVKSGRPLVPVSLSGSAAVLPKKSLSIRPGTIDIVVGKPISTKGISVKAVEPLMEQVRTAIQQHFRPVDREGRP